MKTKRLLFLWIVTLFISTRLNLVDSAPTTEYGETQHKGNDLKKPIADLEEGPLSAYFFRLINFLPSFMKLGSSQSSNSAEQKERHAPHTEASNLTENPRNNQKLVDSSERNPSSENEGQELVGGSEFRLTTQKDMKGTSSGSEIPSSSSPSSSGASDQYGVGMEDNAEVNSKTSTTMGNAVDESAAQVLHNPLERTNEDILAGLKSGSRLRLERREVLIPSKGKLVLLDSGSSEENKEPYEKRSFSTVSSRIRAFAEKVSSIPTNDDFVIVAGTSIPREKVAAVGDIDGNKIQDYIVTNVASKNYSGTVRLYLMGEDDKFLYTRVLTPGKWGFEHPDLLPGDRYGSTVFRLPSTGKSLQCFIAITAPGDRTMKDAEGAVYILELSRKGNVNNHRKLSAKDFLKLVEEQDKEEESISAPQEQSDQGSESEQRSESSQLQDLQHLKGVTSMVFFNASGGVQAVMNVESSKHKDLLHNIDKQLQGDKGGKNRGNVEINSVSSRVVTERSCVFDKTQCDCKLESKDEDQGDCYETFESKEEHGRYLCVKKACPPTYICSCDGDERCRRIEEMEESYVPQAKGQTGELYCTVEKSMVSKVVPVTA